MTAPRKKNAYETLEVRADATAEEIKRVFKELSQELHPDKSNDADKEARYKEITEAYTAIETPEKRRAYDTQLRDERLKSERKERETEAEGLREENVKTSEETDAFIASAMGDAREGATESSGTSPSWGPATSPPPRQPPLRRTRTPRPSTPPPFVFPPSFTPAPPRPTAQAGKGSIGGIRRVTRQRGGRAVVTPTKPHRKWRSRLAAFALLCVTLPFTAGAWIGIHVIEQTQHRHAEEAPLLNLGLWALFMLLIACLIVGALATLAAFGQLFAGDRGPPPK